MPNELRKRSLSISSFGVRGVWQRHDLQNVKKRREPPPKTADFDRDCGISFEDHCGYGYARSQ